MVDSEEEFFPTELDKIHRDVADKGLSVLVFAGKRGKEQITEAVVHIMLL